jgi:hypothetical protein
MLKNKKRHPAQTKPGFRTQTKPRFKSHVRAHEEITSNEVWYSDQPPDLGPGFTAAKAQERTSTVLGILLRAAKRAERNGTSDLAEAYYQLHDKLDACRPRSRCGSLACPRCARAFQKAKIAAEDAAITQASKAKSGRHLVFVTVVPKAMMYSPGKFHEIDVKKANRWLKDAMKKVGNRMMLGSADLGWETQAQWKISPGSLAPGDVDQKQEETLRTNRKHLPELLLVLDRTEPMDLMVYTQHRLTAQFGRFAL